MKKTGEYWFLLLVELFSFLSVLFVSAYYFNLTILQQSLLFVLSVFVSLLLTNMMHKKIQKDRTDESTVRLIKGFCAVFVTLELEVACFFLYKYYYCINYLYVIPVMLLFGYVILELLKSTKIKVVMIVLAFIMTFALYMYNFDFDYDCIAYMMIFLFLIGLFISIFIKEPKTRFLVLLITVGFVSGIFCYSLGYQNGIDNEDARNNAIKAAEEYKEQHEKQNFDTQANN